MQQAFTLRCGFKVNQLRSEIHISSRDKNSFHKIIGIWDTGATHTAIDQRIIKHLGLIPIGKSISSTSNGERECNNYFVDLILPDNIRIQGVNVVEVNLGKEIDMLIGMDLITLGTFCISNANEKTMLSFIVPSTRDIDYVPEAKRLNEPDKHPPTNITNKKKK